MAVSQTFAYSTNSPTNVFGQIGHYDTVVVTNATSVVINAAADAIAVGGGATTGVESVAIGLTCPMDNQRPLPNWLVSTAGWKGSNGPSWQQNLTPVYVISGNAQTGWTGPAPQVMTTTCTNANPAIFTATSNVGMMTNNQPIILQSTGLPTGFTANTVTYFMVNVGPGVAGTQMTTTSTLASPAVFTATSNTGSVVNGTTVQLSAAGLPTGFTAGQTYYMVNASGATFQLAATAGGTGVNASSTGTATATIVSTFNLALTPGGAGVQSSSTGTCTATVAQTVCIVTPSGTTSGNITIGFQ